MDKATQRPWDLDESRLIIKDINKNMICNFYETNFLFPKNLANSKLVINSVNSYDKHVAQIKELRMAVKIGLRYAVQTGDHSADDITFMEQALKSTEEK